MKNYWLNGVIRKHWVLQAQGNKSTDINKLVEVFYKSKEESIRCSVAICKSIATKENPISLKIRNLNGKIHEERTYPRSADPESSVGKPL